METSSFFKAQISPVGVSLMANAKVHCAKTIEKVSAKRSADKPYSQVGSIAIIPVRGLLVPEWSKDGPLWGVTGYNYIQAAVQEAHDASDINVTIMDVNSPGGFVSGVDDCVDLISDCSQREGGKPIITFCQNILASAAYHIGSAGDEIISSPYCDIGSIGCFLVHMEVSQYMENVGFKPTIIYSGDKKVDGNPYEALSDRAREDLQADVDDIRQKFASNVARFRGLELQSVLDTEAGMYPAQSMIGRTVAEEIGLIDGVMKSTDVLENTMRLFGRG